MKRFLALLAIATICAGCAGMAHRELSLTEIRSMAAAEIHQCCSDFTSDVDLKVENTPKGWRVEAPSKCPAVMAGASTVAGTRQSIDEIENTPIMCSGGGASLFYDKEGTLLKLIRWQ